MAFEIREVWMGFGNDIDALGDFFLGKGASGAGWVFPREEVRIRAILVDAEMGIDYRFWVCGGSWLVWGAVYFLAIRGGFGVFHYSPYPCLP